MSEPGSVFRLADLVAYQDGSIVSRKLATAAGGNISVFAFAAGEELSEHSTPHTAILQVLDGVAAIRIASEEHQVGEGETIILPAAVPHAVKAVQRFKMCLTMLRSQT